MPTADPDLFPSWAFGADAIASDALFYALATTQDLDAMPWMRPKS